MKVMHHGRIIDEFVVCCHYHKEQISKTRNYKDNTFSLQIFVKSKVRRSKILLIRRKKKRKWEKGGNENVRMTREKS